MTEWCAEDGQRLRQLRETLAVDESQVARLACISTLQLRELEGQGDGHFYTPAIKRMVGARLLKILEQHIAKQSRELAR